jgi:ribonuclease HI
VSIREAIPQVKTHPNIIPRQKVAICTDSQPALKAVISCASHSKLVKECRAELASLEHQLKISLIWVPGHGDIPGNEEAD